MPGLMIGIPTLEKRPVHIDWAFALKSINPPINFYTVFSIVKNKPVAEARNEIVKEAVRQNLDYIFFIGDDTIPPPHTLRQLIFRMENDTQAAVVGGVYFSKSDPPAPLLFRGNGHGSYWDWKVGEYFEVTGMGMDCTMIRVDLLKKMSEPWFVTVDGDQFIDGTNHAEMWTEDLYFFNRVATEFPEAKIMCDAGIIAEHVDIQSGKRHSIPPNSLPMRRLSFGDNPKNTHKIVDLGCGPVYQQFDEGVPIRVDLDERWNPDYRADVRNLPFDNGQFDIVFSSHVLEHFSKADQDVCLKEWKRILKPGGELRLVLPNIEWAAAKIIENPDWVKDERLNRDIRNVLYGGQTSQFDFHYNGFTPRSLTEVLVGHGFYPLSSRTEGYNIIANFRDGRKPMNEEVSSVMTVCANEPLQEETKKALVDVATKAKHSKVPPNNKAKKKK